MKTKPNCYKCIYRGDLVGDAHSSCKHPSVATLTSNHFDQLLSLCSAVGMSVTGCTQASAKLKIQLDPTGVNGGWANWPFNFDPRWILRCKGFKAEKKKGR